MDWGVTTVILEEGLVLFTLAVEMDAITLIHAKREKLIINVLQLLNIVCFEERTKAALLQVWNAHSALSWNGTRCHALWEMLPDPPTRNSNISKVPRSLTVDWLHLPLLQHWEVHGAGGTESTNLYGPCRSDTEPFAKALPTQKQLHQQKTWKLYNNEN